MDRINKSVNQYANVLASRKLSKEKGNRKPRALTMSLQNGN
jgi:hypothetical protein